MATRHGTMTELNRLQQYLAQNVPEGQPVELFLGVDRDLSADELDIMQDELQRGGLVLLEPIGVGSSGDWDNTVRVKFSRPAPLRGEIGVLPLAVLIIGALGAIGIGGIAGWKLGNIMDSFAKNIVPLALILGGIYAVVTIAKKSPAPAK